MTDSVGPTLTQPKPNFTRVLGSTQGGTERVFIVDGNNLAIRIIKALEYSKARLSDEEGLNTGPLHTFAQSMHRYIEEFGPSRIAVCFDGSRDLRRLAIHPEYKGTRKQRTPEEEQTKLDQFALIKEWLGLAGIFHIELLHTEADDIIAWYCKNLNANQNAIVLSADKDMLQLVSDRVMVVAPGPNQTQAMWTPQSVLREYGIKPHQFPILNALVGDKSDNIDGIPGIGPKKGLRICQDSSWSTEIVLLNEKVAPYRDLVLRNLELIDMDRIPDLGLGEIPMYVPVIHGTEANQAMLDFLEHHGMKTLLSRWRMFSGA